MTESRRPDDLTADLDRSDWIAREVRDDGDRVTGYQVIATTAGAERIVATVPYRGYADWLITRLSQLGHGISPCPYPDPELRARLRATIAPYVGPGYGPIDGLLSALDPFLIDVFAAGREAAADDDGPSSPRLGHVPGRSW